MEIKLAELDIQLSTIHGLIVSVSERILRQLLQASNDDDEDLETNNRRKSHRPELPGGCMRFPCVAYAFSTITGCIVMCTALFETISIASSLPTEPVRIVWSVELQCHNNW